MLNLKETVIQFPHDVEADFTYAYKGEIGNVEVKVKKITENLFAVQTMTPLPEVGQYQHNLTFKSEGQLTVLLNKDISKMIGYKF